MSTEKRTFSLPQEHTAFIDQLVRSGSFASASEVVRAGIRALQERDIAIENWLQNDVAPVYDLMQKNPNRGISLNNAFAKIHQQHIDNSKNTR